MSDPIQTSEAVQALFVQGGQYRFARWGRPVVPVVFGVEDATLGVFKGAIEAILALAAHPMADHDPELGANLLIFCCRDWDDLRSVPNLERLVEGLASVIDRLEAQGANQYRMFRFDSAGAIRAAFVFLRFDAALASVPAQDLALDQAARVALIWGDGAFAGGMLARAGGQTILHPAAAAVIRAGYDPVLPAAAQDPAHALRLHARLAVAR